MRSKCIRYAIVAISMLVVPPQQNSWAHGDIERVLGLLDEYPDSCRATGTITDFGLPKEIGCTTFDYQRIHDDVCLVKTFVTGERSVVIVKDGMLHAFRLKSPEDGNRPFLHRQGRLPDQSWKSFENSIIGGGLIAKDLVLVDPEYRGRFDAGDLLRQVKSERIRRIDVLEVEEGTRVVVGPDSNGPKVSLLFGRNGNVGEVVQLFDRYESRQQFTWEGNQLRFVREEARNSIHDPWISRKEVSFDTWQPNARVEFTLEEHGIKQRRYYLPIAIVVPLIGLGFMLLVYVVSRGRSSLVRSQNVQSRARRGVTVVELMVVITILTLLTAIGLPAVHAVREASRLTSCKNNSRQIGVSLIAHQTAHGSFPSSGWGYRWYPLSDRSGESQPGGWMYHILPYLEQQSLYSSTPNTDDLRLQKAEVFRDHGRIVVSTFHCPSKFNRDHFRSYARMVFGLVERCARPDYALSGGTSSHSGGWGGPETIEESASADFVWPIEIEMGIARRRYVRKTQEITDGLSNTVLLGEKKVACSEVSQSTGSDGNPDDQPYFAGFGQDNVRWTGHIYRPWDGDFFGLNLENDCTNGSATVFGGPHPGITVFVKCDGSVLVLSNTMERLVLARLGHICDGQSIEIE